MPSDKPPAKPDVSSSERLYPKLSPAEMEVFLDDFKRLMDSGAVRRVIPISAGRKPKP